MPRTGRPTTRPEAIAEWMASTGRPVTVPEIADAVDAATDTVRKLLYKMVSDGRVHRLPERIKCPHGGPPMVLYAAGDDPTPRRITERAVATLPPLAGVVRAWVAEARA